MAVATSFQAGPPLHGSPVARLTTLGGFGLHCDGEELSLPPGAERLLAYVALHGRAVGRAEASSALWLDASDDRATASLRSTLWRLRRVGADVVEGSRGQLRLAPQVEVDVRQGAALAQDIAAGSSPLGGVDGRTALRILTTDLLPGWYDDWLLIERERWLQLRLHALESLARRLCAAEAYAVAVEAALAAVAAEPLRESAHACLIAVYLAEGNRIAARRAHERLTELLDRELGVRPSEALERLVDLRGLATATRR
jgi:DNA-binding SARP family transcriptional activator